MDRGSHVAFGVASWLVVASEAGVSPWLVVAGVPPAAAFSTLPDADNSRFARKLDGGVADELLGHGGPLRHRGITHWWGWPAMAAVLMLETSGHWFLWAALVGFASHIVGDFIFGEEPPGVPVFPWWGHVGLRLKSGGLIERLTVPVAVAAAVGFISMPILSRLIHLVGISRIGGTL